MPHLKALLLLAPLSCCCGCRIPPGEIVSVTQSFIGIRVGQNPQTGTPQLDVGFVRTTFQIVPTSTNVMYAPQVNSSLSLDQRAFTTSIDENFLTGGAKAEPDSPAALGARMRPKREMK